MTMKERLIHTALFELGTVIVGSILAVKFSTANPKLAVGADMVLTVGIMIYALMFNWIYDKVRLKVA